MWMVGWDLLSNLRGSGNSGIRGVKIDVNGLMRSPIYLEKHKEQGRGDKCGWSAGITLFISGSRRSREIILGVCGRL